jgi:hypothetical protein
MALATVTQRFPMLVILRRAAIRFADGVVPPEELRRAASAQRSGGFQPPNPMRAPKAGRLKTAPPLGALFISSAAKNPRLRPLNAFVRVDSSLRSE